MENDSTNQPSAVSNSDGPSKKRFTLGGCWTKALLGVGVLAAALVTTFFVFKFIADAKLREEYELIKESGAPTTPEELGAAYVVPEGHFDATPSLELAIRQVNTPIYRKDCAVFPIVGTGAPVPAQGMTWPQEQKAVVFLKKYSEALDHLHTLRSHSKLAVRFERNFAAGFQMAMRNTGAFRDCARLLALQAHVRIRKGDLQGAAESIVAIRRLSDSVANEPLIVSALISIAIDGSAIELYREFAKTFADDPEALAILATSCNPRDYPQRMHSALISERAGGLQAFDMTPAAMRVFMPGDKLFYMKFMREVLAATESPIHEAIAKTRELTSAARIEMNNPRSRKHLSAMILPAIDAFTEAMGRAAAQSELIKVAVIAQQFRLSTGRFPRDLTQLEGEAMKSAPLDPFDGKLLRWNSENDSITVYSIGKDLKDDGGTGPMTPDLSIRIQMAPSKNAETSNVSEK